MDNAMDGKDTVNIAPKKANWDLKRDGADKLATLYRLTTISIVQVSVMIYLSSQTDISLSQSHTSLSLSELHVSLSLRARHQTHQVSFSSFVRSYLHPPTYHITSQDYSRGNSIVLFVFLIFDVCFYVTAADVEGARRLQRRAVTMTRTATTMNQMMSNFTFYIQYIDQSSKVLII